MQRNRLSSRSGRSTQRFHIFPFGLLQMCVVRHQIDAENLLQQSAQARGQRGNWNGHPTIQPSIRPSTQHSCTRLFPASVCRFIVIRMYQKVGPAISIRHRWAFGRRSMHPNPIIVSTNKFAAVRETLTVSDGSLEIPFDVQRNNWWMRKRFLFAWAKTISMVDHTFPRLDIYSMPAVHAALRSKWGNNDANLHLRFTAKS